MSTFIYKLCVQGGGGSKISKKRVRSLCTTPYLLDNILMQSTYYHIGCINLRTLIRAALL